MTRRQRSCRHLTGGWHLTGRRHSGGASHAMRIFGSLHRAAVTHASRPTFHYPFTAFALQDVAHVESGTGGVGVFGLEMNGRIGLVLAERDLCHRYVHAGQVGALGEVVLDALAHCIFGLDVLLAGTK